MLKRFLAIGAGLALCAALLALWKQHADREAWVSKCLAGFKEIKPGMTRAEIGKHLKEDGGIQSFETVRYLNPECYRHPERECFKINVEFSVKRDPSDQNRIFPSPDDKAVTVSKPYIENPDLD